MTRPTAEQMRHALASAIEKLPGIAPIRLKMYAEDLRHDRIPADVFTIADELEIDHEILFREYTAVVEETIGCSTLTSFRKIN